MPNDDPSTWRRGVAVAVVRDDGQMLMVRRSRHVLSPLKVCFPGGMVEPGESPADAVVREMREELALDVRPLAQVWEHVWPERRIVLLGWVAELVRPQHPTPHEPEIAEVLTLTPEEGAAHADALPTNRSFIAAVQAWTAANARPTRAGARVGARVGVVATSSAVPMVELAAGVDRLRSWGFDVAVHPHAGRRSFTFAGDDADRAAALWDYARDDAVDVVWAARGGYGATRLLPELDRLTDRHGPPPRRKLLVGYSDVTVLHELARRRWGWATLHAPMPASGCFLTLAPHEERALRAWVARRPAAEPWAGARLRFVGPPPASPIEGPLVGGNLTLWNCLTGTPWQPAPAGHILFFEDLGEAWYRVDRMVVQLEQAGAFAGAAAVVLGDFTDCKDERQMVAAPDGAAEPKRPLRRFYEPAEAIDEIFGGLARRTGVPVAVGLPVGHGPHFAPLPLGAPYRLATDGSLSLLAWDWINGA